MKKFELVVGEDVIPFFTYRCNEDGTAIYPYMENQIYAFENNAKVVEVTHLDYLPKDMSIYDEESNTFTNPDNSENMPLADYMQDKFRFVYVIDDVVHANSVLRQDENGKMSMLIAALQSNPIIRASQL